MIKKVKKDATVWSNGVSMLLKCLFKSCVKRFQINNAGH